MATATILETYPDANPASPQIGTDNMVHFTDTWGESWCASGYTNYWMDELNETLELVETIEDDKITSFCPGCKETADEIDE